MGGIDLDWDPAPRPDDRDMNEHEHALVVHVEESLGLEVNRGTVPGPRLSKLADFRGPSQDLPVRVDRGEVPTATPYPSRSFAVGDAGDAGDA